MEFRGINLHSCVNFLVAAYLAAAFIFGRKGRVLKTLTAVFLAVAAAYYVADGVLQPLKEPGLDFRSYYVASRDLASGGDPYAHYHEYLAGRGPYPAMLAELGVPPVPRAAYPPLFYLAFSPVAQLPYETAWTFWVFANVAMLAGAFVLAARVAGLRGFWPWAAAAALTLVAHPIISNVAVGQANLFVACLLFGGTLAWQRGKEAAAGALFAAAALVKLFPLIFLLYFLLRRRWRAAATFGVTVAAFVAACACIWGFSLWQTYATKAVAPFFVCILPYGLNVSWAGLLARLLEGFCAGPDPWYFPIIIRTSSLGFLIGGTIWLARSRFNVAAAAASLITLALLFNNWTLFHSLILLLLPFLRAAACRQEEWPGGRLYFAALAVAYLLVAWRVDYRPDGRFAADLLPSLKTAGMLILLAAAAAGEILSRKRGGARAAARRSQTPAA
jgi:hypothetical protein